MVGRKKPLVVITRKLPDQVETRMRELFDARLVVEDRPMTQPELVAAVVQVGPHDFSRSAYHNGVFDLYNFLEWSEMMAHQEASRGVRGFLQNATADRRLRPVFAAMPIMASARTHLGAGAPWFESWLEHPDITDEFWSPLQCGDALDRIAVPTLLFAGSKDTKYVAIAEQMADPMQANLRVLTGCGHACHLEGGSFWSLLKSWLRG